MQWADFKDKKVALLGAGIENVALIPHLEKAGAKITVCNQVETAVTKDLKEQGVPVVIGEHYLDNLDAFAYVFRVAGLPVATLAKALGGLSVQPIVTSPTDLFLGMAPSRTIGVTGTKGKGTTATMIGSILAAAGQKAMVVGNIGRPMFSVYDELTPDTFVIIELASFQLEDVRHSPAIAVLLPVTEDHLQPLSATNPNFHPSVAAYVEAKSNIVRFQKTDSVVIYPSDNPAAVTIAMLSPGKKLSYQVDCGDKVNVDLCGDDVEFFTRHRAKFINVGGVIHGTNQIIDALAAALCTLELGIPIEKIEEGLKNFQPLPHRQEMVGTFGGVTFIDDSYATTPDSAIGALSAFDEPIIWIAGGSAKGADFTELARRFAWGQKKAAILLGQEAPRLKAALERDEWAKKIPIFVVGSLAEAMSQATKLAKPGDVILLSPACASKDMFKDAADRGEQFQQLVRQWGADEHQI